MSRISHRYKFIFFSYPKTGSETVRSILDPYSDIKAVTKKEITKENPFYSHISPRETKQIFKEKGWDYDSYYKFTFIRNPHDRLLSLFNMKYKLHNPTLFSKWVSNIDQDSKERGDWYKNGIISFKNFISDTKGNILVDEVIKLEEIDSKLPMLLSKLGITINNVPHINKGHYSTKKDINKDVRNIIIEKYNWDIRNYNY